MLNESSTRNGGLNNTFGYDAMGNPVSWKGQARTFNANNQETTGGTGLFAYDGNGNPTTYQGNTLSFDENDKVKQFGSGSSTVLQAGYRSDGLRAWKNSAAGTTYFLYDGSQLVCEFDGGVNLSHILVWGANGLLGRQNGTTTTDFVWNDRGVLGPGKYPNFKWILASSRKNTPLKRVNLMHKSARRVLDAGALFVVM